MFVIVKLIAALLLIAGVCIAPPAAADASTAVTYVLAATAVVPVITDRWLRYADLEASGLVNNRVTLARMVDVLGFPAGVLVSPNRRLWRQSDIDAWLRSRPTERKAISPLARRPVKPVKPSGPRPRRRRASHEEAEASKRRGPS